MRRVLALSCLASALVGCVAVYGFDDFDTALPVAPDGGASSVPFALAAPAPARLRRGAQTSVAIAVERHDDRGPIAIEVDGLPAGVSAPPLVVPADASTGTLVLTASATAPFGAAGGVVRARGAIGGTKDAPLGVTVVGAQLDPTFGNGGIILGSPGESLEAFALDARGRAVLAVVRAVGALAYIDVYRDEGNGGFGQIIELRTDDTGEPDFALAAPGTSLVTTQLSGGLAVAAVSYDQDETRSWTVGLGNPRGVDARPLFAFPSPDELVIVTKEAVGSPPRVALVLHHVDVADGGSAVEAEVIDGPTPAGELPVAALATPEGIVVCTTYGDTSGTTLVRLRRVRDGRLDPSFGESGVRDLDESDAGPVRCVDLATSGDRLLALATLPATSRSAGRAAVFALDGRGADDPTFGVGGLATLGPLDSHGILPSKLAAVPDGGLLISGAAYATDTSSTAVVIGATAHGDLDPTFGEGDGGYLTVPVPATSSAESVWRLADGRVLVVGSLDLGFQDRWFVARYLP